MNARPKLVIFDCDGVLVDSEAISNQVLAGMISDAGLPTTPAESRARYQGLLLADIGVDIERRIGAPLPGDFWERFDAARRSAFEAFLKPVDGAAATVSAIQALGIRTCVASQGRLSKTELTLGLTGLRGLFADHELFSAYSVPRGKPFPDLFLHAAAQIGVPAQDCLVVEDTPSGMRAAIAAGMPVIAYVADAPPLPEFSPPIPAITQLPQLVDLIAQPQGV